MPNITYKFVGDASSLGRAAGRAESSLAKLTKSTAPALGSFGKLGQGLMSAFSPQNLASGPMAAVTAIVAVGAAAKEVTEYLVDAAGAFLDDSKSIARLDLAIMNNTDATDKQIIAINDQIDSLSMLTAIQDDVLRKSYTQLVQDTHDVTKSMELLTLGTDISAGSQLSLEKVTKALGKAYNGNTTALKKMFPDLKLSGDIFDQLKNKFGGFAEAMGTLSPMEKFSIAMDNIKETLGRILAPMLIQLAKFLQSEDFKNFMVEFATNMFVLGNVIGLQTKIIVENFKAISLASQLTFKLLTMDVVGIAKLFMDQLPSKEKVKARLDPAQQQFIDFLKNLKTGPINYEDVVDPAPIADYIKKAADKIKGAGEKFRDSVQFSMGLSEDSKFFNAEVFMNKMRDVVAAAKKLPEKLKALRKAGASAEVLQQVISMGPQAGLAVAEGFLRSGTTKEYTKSLGTLSSLGQSTMANAGGQATYNINVNKANMTADEIIAAIQQYERKTGRKVAFGG